MYVQSVQKYCFSLSNMQICDVLLKVAYYSFITVQEVYTINVQISFIFLHHYSDNK